MQKIENIKAQCDGVLKALQEKQITLEKARAELDKLGQFII